MSKKEKPEPQPRVNVPVPPLGAEDLADRVPEDMGGLPPDPRETDEDE